MVLNEYTTYYNELHEVRVCDYRNGPEFTVCIGNTEDNRHKEIPMSEVEFEALAALLADVYAKIKGGK